MTSSISSFPNLRTLFSSLTGGNTSTGTSTTNSGNLQNLFTNNSGSVNSNININNASLLNLFSALESILGQVANSGTFNTSSSLPSTTSSTQNALSNLASGLVTNNTNVNNNTTGSTGTVTNNTNVNNNTTGSSAVTNNTNVNNNTTGSGTVANNTNANNNTTGNTTTNNTNVNNNTTTADYCPPTTTTTTTTETQTQTQTQTNQNTQNRENNFWEMMQRWDPIGFNANGKRYELATDENKDGKFSGANELVGYDNDWSEMQALDTNKDGHINGNELDNVRLVSGGRNADIKTAGDLGLTDIDLTSYKDNKFNLTLNNKTTQGTQTYETLRELNHQYRRAYGRSM